MDTAVAAKRRVHPVDEVLPVPRLAAYGFQHVLAFYAGAVLCLDLVQEALATRRRPAPDGPGWHVGEGVAAAMIATIPPRGHFADASVALEPDGTYTLRVGTAEFGNGTTTVHTQLAAAVLGTEPDRVVVRQSDTDAVGHDTGAFGSAGSVVAGRAVHAAATALRERILAAVPGKLGPLGVQCGERFVGLSELAGLAAHARHDGTPRSLAFNVHGFRVAVHVPTGEVRILRSVQAADAGVVLNPEQCRGQVEGGVAQALGTALYEHLIVDGTGHGDHPGAAAVPHPADGRRPADGGAVRVDGGRPRAVRGQVDERGAVQPGGAGAGERDPRRDRRPPARAADDPRPHLAPGATARSHSVARVRLPAERHIVHDGCSRSTGVELVRLWVVLLVRRALVPAIEVGRVPWPRLPHRPRTTPPRRRPGRSGSTRSCGSGCWWASRWASWWAWWPPGSPGSSRSSPTCSSSSSRW